MTPTIPATAAAARRAPAALLWDVGGTIVDGPTNQNWPEEVSSHLTELLIANGVEPLPATRIIAALRAEHGGYAAALTGSPAVQRTARRFWSDAVQPWPEPAREVIVAHAEQLSAAVARVMYIGGWRVRPGIRRAMARAAAAGIRMAVVSNTFSGSVQRGYLAAVGLDRYLPVQVYSDEEGVRKPHGALLRRAAEALGVTARQCWMIGDSIATDAAAAANAGVGATVHIRSTKIETRPPSGITPEIRIPDTSKLPGLLASLLAVRR